MNYKILTSEVAKLLGKSELTIREGIRREYFDFGVAYQVGENNKRWNFTISPAKLADFLGISVAELHERVQEMRNETKTA